MTDTKTPATNPVTSAVRCRVTVEEIVYGRKEPWLTLARKRPAIFGFIMKFRPLERWTRGAVKHFSVTQTEE